MVIETTFIIMYVIATDRNKISVTIYEEDECNKLQFY